jgi:threonine/homoserine/homoserine lactone efflux protein
VLNALSAAVLGFLLGLRHATDADHVVAVTAIVARERQFSRAARIGALWGIGHSLTLFVIGGAIVAFRIAIPPRLGLALEFGVALMLILLGFSALRPGTAESGADAPHAAHGSGWRPLLVGVVHGLAGSAAVALLVLAVIPDTAWALAYLFVFGVGTVAGMTVVTWLIAAPAMYAATRVARLQRGIRFAAGTLSLLFGLVLARTIVVDGGLFRATPSWTPR